MISTYAIELQSFKNLRKRDRHPLAILPKKHLGTMSSCEVENSESLRFRLVVHLDREAHGPSSHVVQFICYPLFDRMKLLQDLSRFFFVNRES